MTGELIRDGMQVHHREPFTPAYLPTGFWIMGENRRTQRKPIQTQGEIYETLDPLYKVKNVIR